MSDYKPSEVELVVPPLCGTMDKAEAEFAAALIVRTCQQRGDVWQAVTWKDCAEAWKADVAAKRSPFFELSSNPFFRPDVWELVERGFGRWVDKEGGAAELTPKGLEVMRSWVRSGRCAMSCKPVGGPGTSAMPGWVCCACRGYNGSQRAQCAFGCRHKRCDGGEPADLEQLRRERDAMGVSSLALPDSRLEEAIFEARQYEKGIS